MGDENLKTTGRLGEKKKIVYLAKKNVTKKMGISLDPTSLMTEAHREEGQEYMTLKKLRNSGDSREANSVATS
jgi:hypothetical protein